LVIAEVDYLVLDRLSAEVAAAGWVVEARVKGRSPL